MLILMKLDATRRQIDDVKTRVSELGFTPHEIPGAQRMAIGITGNKAKVTPDHFLTLPGVTDVISVSKPFKLVGRDFKPDDTVVDVGGVTFGGTEIQIIAGPCSVESREQIMEAADVVRASGARLLRGGAFKPRSSPYAFQGLKLEGLEYLKEAAERTGLKVVTEVKDTETLDAVAEYSDLLQIGARNMYNFSLLERVGDSGKPVLLKRGFSSTVEELLMAAEYIVSRGNYNVILCERGIRTFETATRNTLDLNAVPVLKKLSHLPVIVDPSHGTGAWDLVPPMSMAALAAGADGLMLEVHAHPERALSDGYQSLAPDTYRSLMLRVKKLEPVLGRTIMVN
ncbi:MAG: 3-deoxy-7-phosphoheptulonate synthase [Bacteroidetes bacterium]|nr:MAG: 3-deoxy-7-phosphoheptulonate synthase [Bacteroidota bacterium]